MFVSVNVNVIVHIIARARDPLVRALKIIAIVFVHRARDPLVRALKIIAIVFVHIIALAGDVILPISINRIIRRALKSSRTTILGKMLS